MAAVPLPSQSSTQQLHVSWAHTWAQRDLATDPPEWLLHIHFGSTFCTQRHSSGISGTRPHLSVHSSEFRCTHRDDVDVQTPDLDGLWQHLALGKMLVPPPPPPPLSKQRLCPSNTRRWFRQFLQTRGSLLMATLGRLLTTGNAIPIATGRQCCGQVVLEQPARWKEHSGDWLHSWAMMSNFDHDQQDPDLMLDSISSTQNCTA